MQKAMKLFAGHEIAVYRPGDNLGAIMPSKPSIPRWQQGFRPFVYGPTWDAMTPAGRRRAFLGDVALALGGALAMALLAWACGKS